MSQHLDNNGVELVNGQWQQSWRVSGLPLNEVKDNKRNELKRLRDETISAPINNVQVATINDRENVTGTINSFATLAPSGSIDWIMADNTIAQLTLSGLETIRDTYALRKAQAYENYATKLLQLDEATTVEEVEAIQW